MACGKLVKILLHAKVTRYLEFKSIDGSYVFKDGKVQKIPGTFVYLCIGKVGCVALIVTYIVCSSHSLGSAEQQLDGLLREEKVP
jgi:hypothetical protein